MSVHGGTPGGAVAAGASDGDRDAAPAGERLGTVRIAPNVLATIAALTTLAVPGVARLVDPSGVGRLVGRERAPGGVRVEVRDGSVQIELHIAAQLGAEIVPVCQQVQRGVSEAIPTMAGMPVGAVDVYVDDVE